MTSLDFFADSALGAAAAVAEKQEVAAVAEEKQEAVAAEEKQEAAAAAAAAAAKRPLDTAAPAAPAKKLRTWAPVDVSQMVLAPKTSKLADGDAVHFFDTPPMLLCFPRVTLEGDSANVASRFLPDARHKSKFEFNLGLGVDREAEEAGVTWLAEQWEFFKQQRAAAERLLTCIYTNGTTDANAAKWKSLCEAALRAARADEAYERNGKSKKGPHTAKSVEQEERADAELAARMAEQGARKFVEGAKNMPPDPEDYDRATGKMLDAGAKKSAWIQIKCKRTVWSLQDGDARMRAAPNGKLVHPPAPAPAQLHSTLQNWPTIWSIMTQPRPPSSSRMVPNF